jgi:hypothetical protein
MTRSSSGESGSSSTATVELVSTIDAPQCEHGNEAAVAISISLGGCAFAAKSSSASVARRAVPWHPFGYRQPISRNTSKFGEATHFRVEGPKMRCAYEHSFPRAARITVVQVFAREHAARSYRPRWAEASSKFVLYVRGWGRARRACPELG